MIKTNEVYSLKRASKITEETPRRIDYWVTRGLFIPADSGSGTGTNRYYSISNLMDILIAKHLADASFEFLIIKAIVGYFHREAPDFFSEDLGIDVNLETNRFFGIEKISKRSVVTRVITMDKVIEYLNEKSHISPYLFIFDLKWFRDEIKNNIRE